MFVFRKRGPSADQGEVKVIWGKKGRRKLKLSGISSSTKAYDKYGVEIPVESQKAEGKVIEISKDPIFIYGEIQDFSKVHGA